MGITALSLDRLNKYECLKEGVKMLELGAQNVYNTQNYADVAKALFESMGVIHTSIDIHEHQGAIEADLREPLTFTKSKFDVVTDFGTCEHLDGSLYEGFKNIHNLCKKGGLMIHENPKTGNWPEHGYHYFTKDFYTELAEKAGYEILELTEEAAMGNFHNGWNVCCVLRKLDANQFVTEEEFNSLDFRKS